MLIVGKPWWSALRNVFLRTFFVWLQHQHYGWCNVLCLTGVVLCKKNSDGVSFLLPHGWATSFSLPRSWCPFFLIFLEIKEQKYRAYYRYVRRRTAPHFHFFSLTSCRRVFRLTTQWQFADSLFAVCWQDSFQLS